jgi:hypothetical protein
MPKNYIIMYVRVFGPAIINGFLKFRFICLRSKWKRLAGLVGFTREKFASWMFSKKYGSCSDCLGL